MSPEEHQKTWMLRKVLNPMGEVEAMEWLIDKLGVAKTNEEFFEIMKRS
jgi:transcription termination factor rho